MTWASVARGDHRPSEGAHPPVVSSTPSHPHNTQSNPTVPSSITPTAANNAGVTNIAASAPVSNAVTSNPSFHRHQSLPPAPPAPPAHIAVEAWPLVGQTSEEAKKRPQQQNPPPSSTTGATGGTNAAPQTTPHTAPARALSHPQPRRSAWGPPDPPPRPPSNTAAPPDISGASPAAQPPSPLHIPSIRTATATAPTAAAGTTSSTSMPPKATTESSEVRGGESIETLRLARVQDYYVNAFQRAPHQFLCNFFNNLGFQAGVVSAGLTPDNIDNNQLINNYASVLGNDTIFYAPVSTPSGQTDWSPPPSRQSPRSAPPQHSPQQNRRHAPGGNGSSTGGGGRQRNNSSNRSTASSNGSGDTGRIHPANPYVMSANGTPQHFRANPIPFTQISYVPQIHHYVPSVHNVTSRVTSRSSYSMPTTPNVAIAEPHIVEIVNRECARIVASIQPSEDENRRRKNLISLLQRVVRNEWEGATVSCFGSAANGLALTNGDVDVCLMVPKGAQKLFRGKDKDGRSQPPPSIEIKAENEVQVLQSIKDILVKNKMEIRSDLCHARVPILKLFDPQSQFQIDMCVNNRLVDHNTALVRAYMDLDERVRPLCLLIKSWAKNRDVNTTYRGTLSSYAYVLLVINFCQTRSPPVLPCLQRMVDGVLVPDEKDIPKVMVDHADKSSETPNDYNVYFDKSKKKWTSHNTATVGQLLISFFKYFAFEFEYKQSVVCPRLGCLIPRVQKKWDEASVLLDAEEAEREFRKEKEALELEEELLEAQKRTVITEAKNTLEAEANGVEEGLEPLDASKVTLDASAAPFLPLSPTAPTEYEGSSGKTDEQPAVVETTAEKTVEVPVGVVETTVEKAVEVPVGAACSSSKSASVRSQDSIGSQKEEGGEDEDGDVPEIGVKLKSVVLNGSNKTDRGDSVSSSVTSADGSPVVTIPQSPQAPAPPRERLRKPRPVERHAFCIEDPFNMNHDLSRGADEDTIHVIREEFVRAYGILSETGNLGNALYPIQYDSVGRTINFQQGIMTGGAPAPNTLPSGPNRSGDRGGGVGRSGNGNHNHSRHNGGGNHSNNQRGNQSGGRTGGDRRGGNGRRNGGKTRASCANGGTR